MAKKETWLLAGGLIMIQVDGQFAAPMAKPRLFPLKTMAS
jgi:hypothetical protein